MYGRVREEIGLTNVFIRPDGLQKNAETAIFVYWGGWICQKKGRGILVDGGRRKKMHRCALVAKR